MRYEIRPLGPWLDAVTPDRWPAYLFRADWASTLDLLGREADKLDAPLVVLQVDVTEGEIRRDGMLRANARVGFPGVRVSFTSKHGPLMYSTDKYDSWKANVRAIALALEALRAVDRYGVSRRGEQYTGWRALTAGAAAAPATPTMTADEAARVLARAAGGEIADSLYATERLITDANARARAFRIAARHHHPDQPHGDAAIFARVTEAREILDRLDLRQA